MTIRQRVALSALLAIPLTVNAPLLTEGPPSALAVQAGHGLAFAYLTSGDSSGWAWSWAYSVTTAAICATMMTAPPAGVVCFASAAA